MLIGYGALKVVVLMVRIGSASGTSDSRGSPASIGQVVSRSPSESLKLLGAGDVNTSPLLAAPTDRLWPVPMTPTHFTPAPPVMPSLPPPQLAIASASCTKDRIVVAARSRDRIGACAAVYCARPRRKTTMLDRGLRAMRTSLAPAPARCQALYQGSVLRAGGASTISGT